MINISKKLPPVKCPVCDKQFLRHEEEYVQDKRRYYHKECYGKEPEDEEKKQHANLVEYIKLLRGTEDLPPLIFIQIAELSKELELSYLGIQLVLEYFHEIKGHTVANSDGIGIVRYVYKEAINYYTELQRVRNHNKDIEWEYKPIEIKVSNRRYEHKTFNLEDFE